MLEQCRRLLHCLLCPDPMKIVLKLLCSSACMSQGSVSFPSCCLGLPEDLGLCALSRSVSFDLCLLRAHLSLSPNKVRFMLEDKIGRLLYLGM